MGKSHRDCKVHRDAYGETVELVTPEQAKLWLGCNYEKNRPIKKQHVDEYVRAIKAGDWQSGFGETIKISKEGKLLDGQHRLSAIVKSGIPIYLKVQRGVDEDMYKFIDCGASRTASDVLAGHKYARQLATLARARLNWERGDRKLFNSTRSRWSNAEISDYVDEHPELEAYVSKAESLNNKLGLNKLVGALFLSNVPSRLRQDATDFLDKLMTGANISADSPEYVVREQLLNASRQSSKSANVRYPSENAYCWLVKAFNDYCAGKSRKGNYRHAVDDPIPDIKGR